ncbi:unnamed protein product [Aphis gossypii]|uniref:Uncharacterized protein n=1 Tax=Aphis gossypii TaxID=80765 RepID=A0A9P0NJD0_APHGO|nr:unnamed protein product [Aphis gossypii]
MDGSLKPKGLIAAVKNLIIKDAIVWSCKQNDKKLNRCVLVLDKEGLQIGSSACRMHDLCDEGVILVEDLLKVREPINMDAIYLIAPTQNSITAVTNDFPKRGVTKYKAAHIFFTQGKTVRTSHLEELAIRISTVCHTLKEYPSVRYINNNKDTTNFELANLVLEKLKIMKDLNPSMGEGRGKLRSHFTDDNAQNVACFEERDILWTQIRHQHICHAVTVVNEKLKNCVNSLRTLTLTVEKEKCSRYISELQKCMDLYGKDLVNICGLEQNLVMSGITFGADFTDFLSELKSYLNNVNVSTQNKMRLIILFILHKGGLPENIFNEFIQIAQLSPTNIQTIMNLNIILGFCTTKKEGTKIQLPFGHGTRVSDEKFPVSPWTPLIKNLMENCIENKLDPEQCPFVGVNKSSTENHAASSSRYTAPNAMWHKPKASTEFQGSRVIIYILGGVTYSEMRCAYEVSNKFKNWEIIIGSSNPLTPNDFIQNLSELNKPPH